MISNKKWKELKAEYKNSGSTIQEGNSFFIFSKDEMKHVQNLPKKCTYDHYLDIQRYSQDRVHHGFEGVYIDNGFELSVECQLISIKHHRCTFRNSYGQYDRGDGTFVDFKEKKTFSVPERFFKDCPLKINHYYRLEGSVSPYYNVIKRNGHKQEYIDYHFDHDYFIAEEIEKYTVPTDQELTDKANARMVEDVLEEQMPWLQYM